MNEIARGAEAVICRDTSLIVKERVEKPYRIAAIDQLLRRRRNRREAKVLRFLHQQGAAVPKLVSESEYSLVMEEIPGPKLRDVLQENRDLPGEFGKLVGSVHAAGVVHGDLTTSNVIASERGLVLIDFGLSSFSVSEEDRAVDLHVLFQALQSRHSEEVDRLWSAVRQAYEKFPFASAVLKRLEKVASRGRYKRSQGKK